MTESEFTGFSEKTLEFFMDLALNNRKTWFDEHRADYEKYVLEPAKAFVVAMGKKLQTISPDIKAIPAVNKSLFRLNRDVRFSKDKTPYKTQAGIIFWEGGKRMECPGFYFHLEPTFIGLGSGIYQLPKHMLEPFRKAVVHPARGKALREVIERIGKSGYKPEGKHYKRVPQGFDKKHENADLLLHNGIYTWEELEIPEEFTSKKLVDFCFKRYKKWLPFHEWCVDFVGQL